MKRYSESDMEGGGVCEDKDGDFIRLSELGELKPHLDELNRQVEHYRKALQYFADYAVAAEDMAHASNVLEGIY